jgi:hypothetical protein
MFSNFFSENRAVYEIMSKLMMEKERKQITIWRRTACWTIMATRPQTHAIARKSTLIHAHARAHPSERAHTQHTNK